MVGVSESGRHDYTVLEHDVKTRHHIREVSTDIGLETLDIYKMEYFVFP